MTSIEWLAVAVIGASFLLIVAAIHAIERATQRRLIGLFGWRAVLITAWLGTPIHELSHAVACILFGHRIDEMRLFSPDPQTGQLGYVKHSFPAGNLWAELGTVAIATAPLVGGAAALFGLTAWFYPEPLRETLAAIPWNGNISAKEQWYRLASSVGHFYLSILTWENWGTVRFWVFLYLILCVGCHWAPSRTDYRGAQKGLWMALGLALLIGVGLSWTPHLGAPLMRQLMAAATVLISLAMLALGLVAISALLVWAFTTTLIRGTKG